MTPTTPNKVAAIVSSGADPDPEAIRAVPVRHPGRWIASAVIVVLATSLIESAVRNERFQWDVVRKYLFDERVLAGVGMALQLTLICMSLGAALGVVLAVMRMSPNRLLSGASWVYIWVVRSTPPLVQLLFWNFIAAVYPRVSVGLPFNGPDLLSGDASVVITPFVAAILGLGLNEAAYMAEIVRAGILSVDEGQVDSAKALGMRQPQILRRIILPQAMKVIIPPTGNEMIQVLKMTSLVSIIAVVDLLYAVQLIYAQNFQQIPLLVVACIWYMFFTSILAVIQSRIERHYQRGRRDRAQSSQKSSNFMSVLRLGTRRYGEAK